jgi:hypothetical protein
MATGFTLQVLGKNALLQSPAFVSNNKLQGQIFYKPAGFSLQSRAGATGLTLLGSKTRLIVPHKTALQKIIGTN